MIECEIEVAAPEGFSNADRGKILEDLMRDVFDASGYNSGPAIRVTGMEIDIPATNKVTGEQVYTECKAHRDNLSAEALAKILGNVVQRGVDVGWIVTTSNLTKDAEGWKEDWEDRPPGERRRLQIYTPKRVLELLISSNRIVDVEKIRPVGGRAQVNWYLLLTHIGRFWANVVNVAGVPSQIMTYYADNGERVGDEEVIRTLKSTDTSLASFDWVCESISESDVTLVASAASIVVDVAVGDSWSDYRPARPSDFVGRSETLNSIYSFFDEVRDGMTDTRLFSIRGPSGWGKSSIVAKIRARCSNQFNRNKFFVLAVDMRAATSANYVPAAILRAFSKAVESKFILPPVLPLEAGPPARPLDSESIKDCISQLEHGKKVIVIIFDQFEEVLTKRELQEAFERLRLVSLSVDSNKDMVIVGFSWKSDAFLPQEHPAYYLWHQLADRRLDYQIPIFGSKDVSKTLGKFQHELGQRINPVLRSQLIQHSQGYPWLLKKLCIHVLNLVKNGLSQSQILEKGLDIQSLFEADLSEISGEEILCLKEIARSSPVEWVQIVDQFGIDTYNSLLNRRLIVRSGDRINPYWDIFKDYLITGEAPQVPVSILPGTEVRTLIRGALVAILDERIDKEIRIESISNVLSISNKSAINVVRDLIMFGFVERKGDKIVPCMVCSVDDVAKVIARVLISTLNNHVFVNVMKEELEIGSVITESDLENVFNKAFPYASLREDTRRVYSLRLASYLSTVNFLERTGRGWKVMGEMTDRLSWMTTSRGSNNFLGDAPPEQVLRLMIEISDSPKNRKELEKLKLRNAITCALVLDLVVVEKGKVKTGRDIKDLGGIIKGAVMETASYKIIDRKLGEDPNILSVQLGRVLSDELGLSWSKASCLRRGNGMKRWVKWCWSH